MNPLTILFWALTCCLSAWLSHHLTRWHTRDRVAELEDELGDVHDECDATADQRDYWILETQRVLDNSPLIPIIANNVSIYMSNPELAETVFGLNDKQPSAGTFPAPGGDA